jgi:hypothetical protein
LGPTHEVTVLLKAWRGGDETALDALMPLVHGELQRIARRCLYGERANHSVQATELVNEAFCGWSTSNTSTGRTGRISWRCRRG